MSHDDQVKHLEMVQGIINRMAGNSFVIKGWTITLIAVLLAVDLKSSSATVAWLALFPALGFWSLDAFYVRQERLFRELHKAIQRDLKEGTRKVEPFNMSTKPYETEVAGMVRTMFWRTLPVFYGPMVLVVLVIWRMQVVRC